MMRLLAGVVILLFVVLITHSVAFAQELKTGTRLFVIGDDVTVLSVEDDEEFRIEHGTVFRVEESAPNRYAVRHKGKPVYVDQDDVKTMEETLQWVNGRIAEDPTADHYGLKTHVLYSLRRHSEAIVASDKALELEPEHLTSLQYRAASYFFLNDLEETSDLVEQLKELTPENYMPYVLEFYVAHTRRDMQRAVEAIKTATRLNPWEGALWSNRGLAHFEIGERDEGFASLERAIEMAPASSGGYQLYGIYAFNDRDYKTALKYLTLAADLNDEQFETYRLLLHILETSDDHKAYRKRMIQGARCRDCGDSSRRQFAWELATSPTADRRDGTVAFEIAVALIDTGQNEPEFLALCLKAKAAALAELDRFDEALETLDLINPDSHDDQFRQMKESFEQNEKHRDHSRSETYDL